jgi:ribosomal protein L37AE/L43A
MAAKKIGRPKKRKAKLYGPAKAKRSKLKRAHRTIWICQYAVQSWADEPSYVFPTRKAAREFAIEAENQPDRIIGPYHLAERVRER